MTYRLAANISLLFPEVPYLERPAAAAAAGFDAIESWWPFATATPDAGETSAFLDAIAMSGLPLTGLNLFGGDLAAGERGIVSAPGREDEFAANLEAVTAIAVSTGCRGFNALYGVRLPNADPAEQDALARRNLAAGVRRFAEFGGVLFVEPLSRGLNGEYPIETAEQAAEVVRDVRAETGLPGIGVLFDTFHLTNNGDDLSAVIADIAPLIAHVQLADAPGRGAPGTGKIDFGAALDGLWDAGYRGIVAAEYIPHGPTADGLGWRDVLPHLRR